MTQRSRLASFDMDGHTRPCGAGVDIGAYEIGDCPAPLSFRRGDVDADGSMRLADAVSLLNYLFLGGPEPSCLAATDTDDGGALDLADPIGLLSYLFLGGPGPAAPFADCGPDPSLDDLGCASFAPCGR